ncbi:sigma-70 family RNA polymerase sigma factor [Paludisphaera soli]|uniref:sigma-70 family RNA polymerase sigma factor n=1 Tax=Paludisphaera soli TaxID=2712865 RepID=UPI0013E9AF85|nr:sigma-70 family RNA polymerase sigma factor [Paludisphaera soli]
MMCEDRATNSDAELWRQVREGSHSAFEEVVARYQSQVAGVAYSTCGSLTTSEDVAQETFWAAWRQCETLQDPSRLGSWLCGIARRQAANAARRSAGRTSVAVERIEDREAPDLSPVEEALRREEEAFLWAMLSAIPPIYREALVLYHRQEQSVAEVAASLSLSEAAVKQRLSRGRALLRDRLADRIADGLRRSRPGRSFTAGVMAGLSLAAGPKAASAAAAGLAAKAAVAPFAAGGLLGMLAGLGGGWLGAWLPAQAAPSLTERKLILRSGRRMLVVSIGFAAVILILVRTLGGTSAYLPAWLVAMLAFQAWVIGESWTLSRRIREFRSTPVPPDDRNATAVRRALESLVRNVEGRAYRSRFRFLGLPLLDIQAGDPPKFDQEGRELEPAAPRRTATGWIAVGDEARGVLLAMGHRAFGGVAIGGAAVGLVAFGGVAVGLVGVGGVAVGLLAAGGASLGALAIGGLAVGDLAFGGAAVGWSVAVGGLAVARETALGGASFARHVVVAPEAAARLLTGSEIGVPALDRPIVRAARWMLGQGRPLGIGVGAVAVSLEVLRLRILYRRHAATPRSVSKALGLALLTGLAGCSSPASPASPTRLRLGNGLSVLLRPVAGASQVAVVVLYDIGGDHDPAGRSGLAHLTEHLYVTAAAGEMPARSAQDFFQRYPAGCNAQTGDRYTVFATVGPPEDLEAQVAEAAARMASLRITDADLDREKPRLAAELASMFEQSPNLAAINTAREVVRPTPNGGRRGGLAEQVSRLTTGELVDRWRRFYKPRNARLVLTGAIDAANAATLVRRHFDAISEGEAVPPPGDPGAIATPRERLIPRPPGDPTVAAAAVAAPLPGSPGYAEYLVLGARLMKEGQDGSGGVQIYMPILDDPAALVVSTVAAAGETAEEAARRLDRRLTHIVSAELSPGEAREAQATLGFFLGTSDLPDQALSANVYGVAFTLGRREQLGIDPERLKGDFERVTPESLSRIASEIFGESRRGLARVGPPGAAP